MGASVLHLLLGGIRFFLLLPISDPPAGFSQLVGSVAKGLGLAACKSMPEDSFLCVTITASYTVKKKGLPAKRVWP